VFNGTGNQFEPYHAQVSVFSGLLMLGFPPKRMSLPMAALYASPAPFRGPGLDMGERARHVVPFHSQVSPRKPSPKPPKRIMLPLTGSNAMLAPNLGGGPVPGAGLQVLPFQSHVSPRGPLDPTPPNSTSVWVGGWSAKLAPGLGGGLSGGV